MAELKHYVTAQGYYAGGFYRDKPDLTEVDGPPEDGDGRRHWNGIAWDPVVDTRTYREKRKDAYIAELGEDADFENTVGDIIDVLLKALVTEIPNIAAHPDLGPVLTKIAAIKAANPKP